MAVKHGILGLLAANDCHGYELQSRFKKLVEQSWPIKAPQLYSTLERLEQGGLVVKERVPQQKRPDRFVYSLTKAGTKEFQDWLTTPTTAPRTLRDEFFLKATLALESDPEAAKKLFVNQRRALLELLHQLHQVLTDAGRAGDSKLVLLTKGAIYHAEVDLTWLDDFESVLETGGAHEI